MFKIKILVISLVKILKAQKHNKKSKTHHFGEIQTDVSSFLYKFQYEFRKDFYNEKAEDDNHDFNL